MRIAYLFESVRAEITDQPESVIAVIDYNMNFESIRYREKTVEFFGKRGSGWDGAVIFFANGEGGMIHFFMTILLAVAPNKTCLLLHQFVTPFSAGFP